MSREVTPYSAEMAAGSALVGVEQEGGQDKREQERIKERNGRRGEERGIPGSARVMARSLASIDGSRIVNGTWACPLCNVPVS